MALNLLLVVWSFRNPNHAITASNEFEEKGFSLIHLNFFSGSPSEKASTPVGKSTRAVLLLYHAWRHGS